MKIESSHYLSGMPANEDYKIELINGIVLRLTPDEYNELCACISDKNQKDADAIKKADDRFFKRAQKFQDLITELRGLFYHGDEDGDFMFRTDFKEMDKQKLDEILSIHANVLGLE